MAIQTKRVEFYLNTIWAVAASPYVSSYVIGYTSAQLWKRSRNYRTLGYDHFVILEDKMNRDDALWLEERIQTEIKRDRRHTNYRKYHIDKRDGRYYRSAGQNTTDPQSLMHSVYMAWWE